MLSRFTRVSIGKQIVTGFSVILAPPGGLAFNADRSVDEMKQGFDRSNAASNLFDKANKAQIEVERARLRGNRHQLPARPGPGEPLSVRRSAGGY